MFTFVRLSVAVGACLVSGALFAVDKPDAKASGAIAQPEARLSAIANGPLVFSAPPRESSEEANKLYQPVAEHLTRALGRPVNFVYSRNWLTYQKEMTKGNYDIVFDGAHFNSWRISHIQHNTLAKIAEQQTFVVVTRKDDTQITSIKQLAGKKVCAMGASNLGTLALQSEFDPVRQPLIVEQIGWTKVYESVMENRCIAGTLPVSVLRKLDGGGNFMRVVHQSRQLPNQAFSASPRLTSDEQVKLAKALTSPEARAVIEPLLAANGVGAGKGLVAANKEEYAGMDTYLKDVWGYTR
jgi:ABC-type phosphate/phosphonate transport system substrate-binding protein